MKFAEEERRKEELENAWDQLTQEEVQRAAGFHGQAEMSAPLI